MNTGRTELRHWFPCAGGGGRHWDQHQLHGWAAQAEIRTCGSVNFLRTITFSEPTVQKISFVTSSRVRNSELPVNFSDYQFCNAIFKLISQTFQGIICYLLNSFQSPFSLSNFNKESCFLEEEMLKLCTWTSVRLVWRYKI